MVSVPWEKLVTDFGYIAIVVGTFLEGETILVLGGFLAHRGYLLGETLELVLGEVKRFEIIVLAALAVLGLVIWLCYLWRERKAVKADEPINPAP
jgi:membrane protein DedA with SNARE-associated domain